MSTEYYGTTLKALIKLTNTKYADIASYIGYDISYISKWCSNNKLPSSRYVEHINTKLSEYFTAIIHEQKKENEFYQWLHTTESTDILFLINQQLSAAYRFSLQLGHKDLETKASVRLITGYEPVRQFLRTMLPQKLNSCNKNQELIIYGEFCTLFDADFWSYLDILNISSPHFSIHVGLDKKKLKTPFYIEALYKILNQYINFDFFFYDNDDVKDTNLIIAKNTFVLQYAKPSSRGLALCTYIEDSMYIQDIYEKFILNKNNASLFMYPCLSPWQTDPDYRTSFYASHRFFFFLTNGVEYLLPHHVFDIMLRHANKDSIFSIERLRITWEEILNKSEMTILIPETSLLRYLETGHIDLTDLQYIMSPEERIAHIESVLTYVKENPTLILEMVHISHNMTGNEMANLSFYSNYKTSFFKKNTLCITNDAYPFYSITDTELHHLLLNYFKQFQQSNLYQHYSADELKKIYATYKPLIEKIVKIQ